MFRFCSCGALLYSISLRKVSPCKLWFSLFPLFAPGTSLFFRDGPRVLCQKTMGLLVLRLPDSFDQNLIFLLCPRQFAQPMLSSPSLCRAKAKISWSITRRVRLVEAPVSKRPVILSSVPIFVPRLYQGFLLFRCCYRLVYSPLSVREFIPVCELPIPFLTTPIGH